MKNLILALVCLLPISDSFSQEYISYEKKFLNVEFNTIESTVQSDQYFSFLETKDSIIFGIDVSHYSEVLDWDKIKKDTLGGQPKFAILRSTMGKDSIDNHYQQNLISAKSFGFVTGSYHYFRAHEDGKEQAIHYLKNSDFDCKTFIPIIDIEYKRKNISEKKMRKELLECLAVIEKIIGIKPMVYTNLNFYKRYLRDHGQFDDYPLWIAAYSEIRHDEVMAFAHVYQFTDKHVIDGITYPVDGNKIKKEKFLFLIMK